MEYPKHVGIIPDGNRTRAKAKGMSGFVGHLEGFNKVKEIAEYAFDETDIKVLTVRGLSTENLENRSQKELEYLFQLYKRIPGNLFKKMKKNRINFRMVGNREELPEHLTDFMKKQEEELNFENSDKYLILALNYGGQNEIIRGIKKLESENLEINPENLEKCMDFGYLPKLELVIRTKQKLAKRLSGFMLWRIAYAQLYFTDLHFPDFDVEEFKKALERYNQTKETQNHGK